MAKQSINVGTAANDKKGDSLRAAFQKVNANFTELYAGGTPRVINIASSATITPTADTADQYSVTALAENATIAIPSGTPAAGQKLTIRIKDNGTARALIWTISGTNSYRVVGTTLPNTTVISKVLYVGCIYNATEFYWDVVAVAQQA